MVLLIIQANNTGYAMHAVKAPVTDSFVNWVRYDLMLWEGVALHLHLYSNHIGCDFTGVVCDDMFEKHAAANVAASSHCSISSTWWFIVTRYHRRCGVDDSVFV